MTATETQAPLWVSLADRRPALRAYEVGHRGMVGATDRPLRDGRRIKGKELTASVSGSTPYPHMDLYDEQGERHTCNVHSLVLLAYVGECPEEQEALHFNDNPTDNRWPENLGYGTHPENVVQRMLNRPAVPKPVKRCVRCDAEFTGNGKRCHDCVMQLGALAARMLVEGADLDRVVMDLGYPSTVGVFRLAVRYGGLRLSIGEPEPPALPPSLLQRVTATLRGWRGGDNG